MNISIFTRKNKYIEENEFNYLVKFVNNFFFLIKNFGKSLLNN